MLANSAFCELLHNKWGSLEAPFTEGVAGRLVCAYLIVCVYRELCMWYIGFLGGTFIEVTGSNSHSVGVVLGCCMDKLLFPVNAK